VVRIRSSELVASHSVVHWIAVVLHGRRIGESAWVVAARTNTRSNSSFASDATEQPSLGLLNNFDLSVVAMYAEVGEGSIGRLFD